MLKLQNKKRNSSGNFSPLGKLLWICIACLMFASNLTAFAQTTKRIYLVGNSVTDAINYAGFKAIAQNAGNTHIWARHMIPGAPLSWLWEHPADGFSESPYGYPTNAFPNYVWDAISLQPFDRNIEGTGNDKEMVGNYINLAKGNSPNVQFYVYMRWPRTPDSKLPTDPTLTADTWTNLWVRTYTGGYDGTQETKDFFEDLLVACRAAYTSVKPMLIVPVGEVFNSLNTKMKNGLVPGYSSIWQVYSDGIHMNSVGSYIAALTFYATMYNADPRGTAVPSEYGTIPSNVVSVIQQTAWDVISTYPYSGVTAASVPVSSVSLSPATLSLVNGTSGQLTATVLPSNATNKAVSWSSSNTLIATVSSSGLVSAVGVGNATITVTTADGAKTATCALTVTASGGGGGTVTGILSNWDFVGKGGQSSVAGANLLSCVGSANAAIGSGMSALNYLNDGLTATNCNSTTLAEAIANNDYISFTITPSAGKSLGVSTIKYTPVSQDLSRTFSLFSSKNGFSAANVISSFTASANLGGTQQTITIANHTNITSALEFRMYIYGTGGNIYQSVGCGNATGIDLEVLGSVTGGDTQAPTAASNLVAANVKDNRLDLTWTNATDNVGVTGYDVFVGTTKKNTALLTTNSYQITGLTVCTNYSITVKAYDAAGNSSTSSALAAKTNCAPTAVLNATPVTGNSPLVVAFDAQGSSDPDAGDFILGYDWDFGDGSAHANNNAPSHTYSTAGTYTATLRVMDNRDLYSVLVSKTITVNTSVSLRNPENPSSTLAGLDYSVYSGSFDLLPNFTSLTPSSTGNVANFDISSKTSTDNFAFKFVGFVNVPTDGTYTFYTNSDDGSKLFIGTTEVVNNDGLHAMVEKSGTIGLKAGKHAITVTFFEKTGGEGLTVSYAGPGITKTTIPNSALYRSSNIVTGDIVMEYWEGISGTAVSAIPVSTNPTGTQVLTSLEGPTNWKDNYGVRIRGYVVPTTSGAYTFRVAGDDYTELWLSTNSDPANKTKIAYVNGWTNSREWTKYTSQTSAAITLNANTQYYVEVLMKEGGGGDNVAVAWTGPGITAVTVIPGTNLGRFSGQTGDLTPPTIPANLNAGSISQTGCNLTWTASTDNVAVTGYNVYNGANLLGTTTSLNYTVSGLTCNTTYSFTVRAKDAANNISAASTAKSVTTLACAQPGTPQLPIGMNIPGHNYYETCIRFTDVMTTASDMFTFYDGGPWNSEQIANIPRDVNGYPTQIPVNVGGQNQKVRFLINNVYVGRYYFLYDGVGTLSIGGASNGTEGTRRYVDLNGAGGHVWVDIVTSQAGNYIRNMRILPEPYASSGTYPTFLPKFLDGLRPFHALRFMDWIGTNNSSQKYWTDRVTKTYYTQGGGKGMSFEYAIELCNELNQDAWVCIPHQADDNYIQQCARLWRDNLEPGLKVYIEYSNEIWNWQFSQAGYCVNNAPGHPNAYVSSDLAAIAPAGSNHPEKDAYMMARTFRLWKAEFTGVNAARLVRVAAVQHSWYDNTRRVLEYLFNVNLQGCDVVSPAGYFNFEQAQHDQWLAACTAGQTVDPGAICQAVIDIYDNTSGLWTQKNAEYANQFGVGYVVYEGGQHMQPYQQQDWCYNQSVWNAQIHPKMYELYMKNFNKHVEPQVNCQLFMAFSYMGARESRYGSWGHLESLSQVGSANYMTIAPKYQALLDANSPKTSRIDNYLEQETTKNGISDEVLIFPNPATDYLTIEGADIEKAEILNYLGQSVAEVSVSSDVNQIFVGDLKSGLYFIKIQRADKPISVQSFVKK